MFESPDSGREGGKGATCEGETCGPGIRRRPRSALPRKCRRSLSPYLMVNLNALSTSTGNAHQLRQRLPVPRMWAVAFLNMKATRNRNADANGKTCSKQTVGHLYRRHVSVDGLKYIGKESNSLEDVESGLIHDHRNVYTEYPDERRDEWQRIVRPALKNIPYPFCRN